MGRKLAAPSARALVIAFAAVAVSFVLATLVSERSDVKIRRDAGLITGNAAPSIVHLEAFRSEARRLVVLADDEVDRALERQGQRDAAEMRARAGRAARSARPPLPAPQDGLLPAEVLARARPRVDALPGAADLSRRARAGCGRGRRAPALRRRSAARAVGGARRRRSRGARRPRTAAQARGRRPRRRGGQAGRAQRAGGEPPRVAHRSAGPAIDPARRRRSTASACCSPSSRRSW